MRPLVLVLVLGCGASQPTPVTTAPSAPASTATAESPPPSDTHGDPATRRHATVVEANGPQVLWTEGDTNGKLVAVPLHSRPNQPPGRMVIALTASGVCSATAPCTVYDHSLASGDPQRATYVEWKPYDADHRVARLWGNTESGPFGVLVEIKAGNPTFWHMHGRDVRMVVLAGTVEYLESGQSAHTLAPGSYVLLPGGYKHRESCKAGTDCVIYMHGDRGFDVKAM
jgi:quercetin dioxygenase-like cupin family protein